MITIIGTVTRAIALDGATPSSATRDRLTSEIIRSQDARYDNSGFAVDDRFPLDMAFNHVTCRYIRLAALP
ncbi:hypothetical protein IQ269_24900 [Tychonema sp. LEGE 07199]|uniref:hypothetical protein n=1 Tax=unclassified Tychonema TaxID=2642144 RepID=UPI00188037C1|nr:MULTISPECIES: hypothetical protein [unclassified Tychonema]MBE9123947.1 hypothetical protein [Tychonema sp. LEGE 07199]MBE9135253.1 hypothetical protein [Tychonema sp. LEGE 07196]